MHSRHVSLPLSLSLSFPLLRFPLVGRDAAIKQCISKTDSIGIEISRRNINALARGMQNEIILGILAKICGKRKSLREEETSERVAAET